MENIPSTSKTFSPAEAVRTLYKNWRASFALPLLIGTLIFGAFILYPAAEAANNAVISVVFVTIYLAVALVTFIPFSYRIRMGVFLTSIYILGVSELITHGILGDGLFFFLALAVFATMLFSVPVGILAMTVNVLTFAVTGFLMLTGKISQISSQVTPAALYDWISATGAMLMFGGVIIMGFKRLESEFIEVRQEIEDTLKTLEMERDGLESKVNARTIKLKRVNEIGRAVTSILDPDELIARAVHLIGDEFECYYTAIFLLDGTGQWADLKEATGDAGKVLRENKHRIDINGKSLLATVIRNGQARIALDTGPDPIRFDNPLLPYTRSQIIIPLNVGERIIGALEMHSSKENSFLQIEVDTYQNMANEVSIALENSRLFKEAQQSLSEMRATQRQYLHGAWSTLTAEQNLEYSIGDTDSRENEIEIPLALRDQIIGQIQLTANEEWTPEQKNLIESIATQAALALENARLVEESQAIATRERMANEIIAKVWASTTMDGILQTTVRELGRILEAAEVDIEVSMDNKNV